VRKSREQTGRKRRLLVYKERGESCAVKRNTAVRLWVVTGANKKDACRHKKAIVEGDGKKKHKRGLRWKVPN